MEVNAPPRAVVAHTETLTPVGIIRSVATDPTLYTSTSRVLSGMRMDYDSATNCYVTVRNVSFTNSDTVMLKWCTTDGSAAPAPQSVTLAPGTQTLIGWDASQYLSIGTSLTGVVMMTYTGNPGDIVADGWCESTTTGFAMPAASVAPNPSDGSHLIGEYFSVDVDTPGELADVRVASKH